MNSDCARPLPSWGKGTWSKAIWNELIKSLADVFRYPMRA